MSDSPVPVHVPTYVDTRKVFLQQGPIAGFVALDRLPRFNELLASDKGTVSVELHFGSNDSGQQVISGRIRAKVEVTCQRCLEPLGIDLQDDIKLALLKDESKVETLEADLEPWICQDTRLELAELVEEQLMLCMPIVSYHDEAHCGDKLGYTQPDAADTEHGANGTSNPFSVLKSLKDGDGTN